MVALTVEILVLVLRIPALRVAGGFVAVLLLLLLRRLRGLLLQVYDGRRVPVCR